LICLRISYFYYHGKGR